MGKKIETFTNWVAITTVFCFIFGLLYLSPVYFVLGLAVLAGVFALGLVILNDWKATIFRSDDRFRISYRKDDET